MIGVKNSINGTELPRAYVVLRPGVKLTEQEVYNVVKGKLIKYKWLDGGVKLVQTLPKTPSGKILKRLLREEAAREEEIWMMPKM